jgi:hypothetical protein
MSGRRFLDNIPEDAVRITADPGEIEIDSGMIENKHP